MPTANEQLLDALVRHQVGLLRLAGGIRRRVFALLDATEEDLKAQILARAPSNRGPVTSARLRSLERLLRRLRQTRLAAWAEVTEVWVDEMRELAAAEAATMAGIVRTVAPVALVLELPPVSQLRAIVASRPFEGQVMRNWARRVRQADIRRIESEVRMGVVQGETSRQIARRVVGSVRMRGRDGATQVTRRNAEAITRTAVNAISNESRRQFALANQSVVDLELYVATLDSRTTPVCRSNDGKRYPVGEGPIPPLHFNCRSLRVAILDDEVLGRRPAKPFTQAMLLDEYAEAEGIPLARSRGRDGLPRGHKGRFDAFARRRVRELTGTVPAKVSYQEWLERQSATFQDDVLGPARGRLFRRGGLSLDRFVNRAGDELPLAELARRDRAAFRAAGLDPEDFL